MVFALHAGLGVLLDEGLDASWARHELCGRTLQDGLEKLGFDVGRAGGPPAARADDGVGARRARRTRRPGVDCSATTASRSGAGVGEFAGKVWRIGCMGHTARRRNVTLLLRALDEVLAP